ncbi:MAG: SCP2 sterol-binding domain-containing protein [bacterium]|nr:SCP2 sterol-binding domain-containing protein [bacterium]
MDSFLSDDWLGAVRAAAGGLPEVPGVGAAVSIEVPGGPAGTSRFGVVVTDGRLVELSPGRLAEADCSVSCSYGDACDILAGRLDPPVAYMQGRLKIDGAYEAVLFGLRPLLAADAFGAFAAEVAALTG